MKIAVVSLTRAPTVNVGRRNVMVYIRGKAEFDTTTIEDSLGKENLS